MNAIDILAKLAGKSRPKAAPESDFKFKDDRLRISYGCAIPGIYFWVYGLYNAAPADDIAKTLILAVIHGMAFCLLVEIAKNYKMQAVLSFKVNLGFAIGTLALLMFIGILNSTHLQTELVNDHFSYAGAANIHAAFIANRIYPLVSTNLGNLPHYKILWCINILLALSYLLFFGKAWQTTHRPTRILIFGFSIAAVRIVISTVAGSMHYPHGEAHLFFLWISSLIFGPTAFNFRIVQTIIFVVMLAFITSFTSRAHGRRISLLCLLGILGTPIAWHASSIVESNIWVTASITLCSFVYIFNLKPTIRLFAFIFLFSAVCTLVRPTAALSLIIVMVWILPWRHWIWKESGHFSLYKFVLIVGIVMILPKSMSVIQHGTPSVALGSGQESIPYQFAKGAQEFVRNLLQGVILMEFEHSTKPYYLAVLATAFLLRIGNNFLTEYYISPEPSISGNLSVISSTRRVVFVTLLVFTSMGFVQYGLLLPNAQGFDRYKAEFFLPILFILLIHLITRPVRWKTPFAGVLGVALSTNFIFSSPPVLSYSNFSRSSNSQLHKPSEVVYPYCQALEWTKSHGGAGNVLILGVTYGLFPQILCGETYSEVIGGKGLLENSGLEYVKWPFFDLDSVERAPKVKFIISGDAWNDDAREYFLSNGWILRATFVDSNWLTETLVFERIS